MKAFVFNQRVKHGTLDFHPGVSYGFEDPDAAPYFKACGWGDSATGDADVTISLGELDIDPLTVWGVGEDRGKFVMPDRAAAELGVDIERVKTFVFGGHGLDQFKEQIAAELKGSSNG